ANTNDGENIYKDTETPKHQVIQKSGAIEIREYGPILVAEVTIAGDRKEASSKGFWILATYIFGKNVPKEKVKMTSPVIIKKGQKIEMTAPVRLVPNADGWTIQFAMPSKFNLDTLPEVVDKRITFHTTQPNRQAVIRFSGFANEEAIKTQTNSLVKFLNEQNLTAKSDPILYFYDSPATLPWRRRNEVAVEIA
ncbi:MAG: heme-binding protein, partial [Leptolyngbya sp.]|nr:heme-binding protein [Candidatus Melainabacteria bacterium]